MCVRACVCVRVCFMYVCVGAYVHVGCVLRNYKAQPFVRPFVVYLHNILTNKKRTLKLNEDIKYINSCIFAIGTRQAAQ